MKAPTPEQQAIDLADTYVHLQDDGRATAVQGGEAFWRDIDSRFDEGRLVCASRASGDWPHWEMHPAGDELVILLSGAVDLMLEEGGRRWTVPLRERGTCIVPRGVWHTAVVHAPGELLFVTPGAGTQHRPKGERVPGQRGVEG